jgi:hypothetical protein
MSNGGFGYSVPSGFAVPLHRRLPVLLHESVGGLNILPDIPMASDYLEGVSTSYSCPGNVISTP